MKHNDLIQNLKKLRLFSVAEEFSATALTFEKENKTFEQYLAKLIEIETKQREIHKINRYIKQANLRKNKELREYDFKLVQGITAQQVFRLVEGEFLAGGENIIFFGSFGVGKTHLAEGLARSLCGKGFRCRFYTAHELINLLVKAQQTLELAQEFKKLDSYDLLVIDELGYCNHSKEGADLFFQLISQRYERRSILITTNLAFSEWEQVFLNKVTTAAAVDRIIHKCEIFNISGQSVRAEQAKLRKLESSKKA